MRRYSIGKPPPPLAAIALVLLSACGFAAGFAAQPAKPPNKLVLESPDGKTRIVLEARDDIAGIWIMRGDERREPFVAIYNHKDQGAVVGVYGAAPKGASRTIMDAALACDAKGGRLQLTDEARKGHEFDARRLAAPKVAPEQHVPPP